MASMKITDYTFGKIEIDSKPYDADLIITPDGVIASWWRKQGHRLQVDDLADVEKANPDILIVGTGYFGRMEVPAKTLDHLKSRGIDTHVAKTADAVALFNKLQGDAASVAAALHLTC